MIRIGLSIVAVGIGVISLPFGGTLLPVFGFILLGIGCAPVYPSIIHSTPFHFGKENSQSVIGIQMAFSYIGSSLMPPVFGLLADNVSIRLLPAFLLFFLILTVVMLECLNRIDRAAGRY